MREECLQEMCQSLAIGGFVTMVIFSASHEMFTPGEVIAFWMGTWSVVTYAAWSVIIWIKKCRAARQSKHGKKARMKQSLHVHFSTGRTK